MAKTQQPSHLNALEPEGAGRYGRRWIALEPAQGTTREIRERDGKHLDQVGY